MIDDLTIALANLLQLPQTIRLQMCAMLTDDMVASAALIEGNRLRSQQQVAEFDALMARATSQETARRQERP